MRSFTKYCKEDQLNKDRNMGEMKNSYGVTGKSERKRLLGRPRHRWDDNIRMDLGEIRWESVE
jgi:hypothetical protein